MLIGCKFHVNDKEKAKIELCRSTWTYAALPKKTDIKVLLFDEAFGVCTQSYPNFIIGISAAGDTIGIIESGYDSILKPKENITLFPIKWPPIYHEKPVFSVYNKSKNNDIVCAVKTLYHGVLDRNIEHYAYSELELGSNSLALYENLKFRFLLNSTFTTGNYTISQDTIHLNYDYHKGPTALIMRKDYFETPDSLDPSYFRMKKFK